MAKRKPTPVNVSNCSFIGVQYDANTIEAIRAIAAALAQNADGLTALARAIGRTNTQQVEAFLKIDGR